MCDKVSRPRVGSSVVMIKTTTISKARSCFNYGRGKCRITSCDGQKDEISILTPKKDSSSGIFPSTGVCDAITSNTMKCKCGINASVTAPRITNITTVVFNVSPAFATGRMGSVVGDATANDCNRRKCGVLGTGLTMRGTVRLQSRGTGRGRGSITRPASKRGCRVFHRALA